MKPPISYQALAFLGLALTLSVYAILVALFVAASILLCRGINAGFFK